MKTTRTKTSYQTSSKLGFSPTRLWLLVGLLLLALAGVSRADTVLEQGDGAEVVVTQEMTWSTNATDSLSGKLSPGYLYQVAIKTSADETVTFVIKDSYGNELFNRSWTAAATGEAPKFPTGFFHIPKGSRCTGTLSGLTSGTAKVLITSVKK